MSSKLNEWKEMFGSEWEWVVKLGSCFSDPEEKKSFWETVKAKKLADPSYSVYSDFPREPSANKKAMRECCDFVFGLRQPVKTENKPEERSELQELFGKIIDEGKHLPAEEEESA